MRNYILLVSILFVIGVVVFSIRPMRQINTATKLLVGVRPPKDVQNTPYYSSQKEALSEDELEEVADKDYSRMDGNTMYVAVKDHDDTEQFGYAEIKEINGNTQVNIHTENSEPPLEVKQPTFIHIGSCKQKGAMKYELSPVYNGKSETTLQLSMNDLLKQLPLALYIYRGEGDLKSYNSCGELVVK